MLVLKLCQQNCPDLIPYNLGIKLGDGADGEVFEIADQPDRVIKLGVMFETSYSLEYSSKNVTDILQKIIQQPTAVHARVYTYGSLGIYSRMFNNNDQRYWLYYYVMEKLSKISDDEKRVFHSLISHEDQNKVKNFTPAEVKKMLAGLARGLDFDVKKITFFYENFDKFSIQHLDIHPRNIMKDSIGNFKLIDFDRSQLIGDT